MKRLLFPLLVFFILFSTNQLSAQNDKIQSKVAPPAKVSNQYVHQYYIYLNGVNSKDDVIYLEDLIQKKEGVAYFLGNRFPVRYFLLKTKNIIDETEFSAWIGSKYQIAYFKEGQEAREGALLMFYKSHPIVR